MQTLKRFIHQHPHILWGLYLPVYLILFFTVEHCITDNYWATQTGIDDLIPFCEWFILPYDAWSFLLVAMGLYLLVKDPEGFRRYMWTIAITFTTATIFCFLVPNGQDLRPTVMEHDNFCTWLVQYTYSLDTNTNVFPSVHVLGVMAALFALWHTPGLRRWTWRVGGTALGVVIIAATVLVKQHAFIDILGALFLGGIAYVIVYVWIGRKRDRLLAEGKRLRCGSCENTDT